MSDRAPGPLRTFALLAAVNVVLLGLAFVAGETLLRMRDTECARTRPGAQPDRPPDHAWAEADPDLGWVCNRAVAAYGCNAEGFRDDRDFAVRAAAAGN